jgi:hypothetical protein
MNLNDSVPAIFQQAAQAQQQGISVDWQSTAARMFSAHQSELQLLSKKEEAMRLRIQELETPDEGS